MCCFFQCIVLFTGLEVWKREMIKPLQANLVSHILEGIQQDRLGNPSHHLTDVIRGVIMSFVSVEEYRKSQNPEVRYINV